MQQRNASLYQYLVTEYSVPKFRLYKYTIGHNYKGGMKPKSLLKEN